nr:MAG TPA: hypothetical protein [Caudoviricetes sp.]
MDIKKLSEAELKAFALRKLAEGCSVAAASCGPGVWVVTGITTPRSERQEMDKKSITCAQLSELEGAETDGYHRLLENLTGIKVVEHTVYKYYDDAGNYVGDSDNTPLTRILKRAGVEIKGGEE